MKIVYLLCILVSTIFAESEVPLTTNDVDSPCNCEHCEESKVIGLEKNESSVEEDVDADGNRTICAKNRLQEERSFPSVCHMLCLNRCTLYRIWPIKQDDTDKHIVAARREHYYKLREGPCDQ